MSGLGCVTPGGDGPPSRITDFGTLNLTIDNQGLATLSIIILTLTQDPITETCFIFDLGTATFNGFLDSDTPKRLEGTDYYEHSIVAKGMVC